MPKLPQPRPPANRLVAAVVYDGLATFEYAIAVEVFGLPRPEFGEAWYRFVTCAAEPGPLRAVGGLHVTAEAELDMLEAAGTIIVPGWRNPEEQPPAPLLDALRAAHLKGARILSICSGVFVLAAAGLLDGKRATTHWRYAALLGRRYPQIVFDPDVLYVDEGNVLTSAGSAAGLDLSLHLVRRDWGVEVANRVARRLVLPAHRNGGQKQFVDRPVPREHDARLAAVLDHVRRHPDLPVTVATLARVAAMSERTLVRRFQDATGMAPGAWVIQTRVDRARELLESAQLSIEDVARESGFSSPATLRHHFRRQMRVSPTVYRAQFGRTEPSLGAVTDRAAGRRGSPDP